MLCVLIGCLLLLLLLQEVARMPPFQRRTLVLIGAQGVGRRTLKQRLIKADSSRFGAVTPRKSPAVLTGASGRFLTRYGHSKKQNKREITRLPIATVCWLKLQLVR